MKPKNFHINPTNQTVVKTREKCLYFICECVQSFMKQSCTSV